MFFFVYVDFFFWLNLLTLHKMREKNKTLLSGLAATNTNKNKGSEVLVYSKYYNSKNVSFLFLCFKLTVILKLLLGIMPQM